MIDRIYKFLGYDAVKDRGRRKSPTNRIKSEDLILPETQRKKLISTAQDVQRNFSIAAWAIRKHLDFVSSFSFQSKLGTEFDDEVEEFMAWWSYRNNCDVRRRHRALHNVWNTSPPAEHALR